MAKVCRYNAFLHRTVVTRGTNYIQRPFPIALLGKSQALHISWTYIPGDLWHLSVCLLVKGSSHIRTSQLVSLAKVRHWKYLKGSSGPWTRIHEVSFSFWYYWLSVLCRLILFMLVLKNEEKYTDFRGGRGTGINQNKNQILLSRALGPTDRNRGMMKQ